MSLEKRLLKVDKKIWEQFEKVTVKANKELGWNKYDLARISIKSAGISFLGSGAYIGIMGYLQKGEPCSGLNMASGAIFVLAVSKLTSLYLDIMNREEEKEINIIVNKGAPSQPNFSTLRPLYLPMGSLLVGKSIFDVFYGNSIISESIENLKINDVGDLSNITYGAGLLLGMGAWYFKDQLMVPPSKKKSLLKTLYNKVNPFKETLVPVPQESPGQSYQSLDSIIIS